MNLWRVLKAPWVATTRGRRWRIGIALGLGAPAAIVLSTFHGDATMMLAVALGALALGSLWVFALPSMLALTLLADRLRLPGVRRDVVMAFVVYAVLSIPLPAALLGLAGWPTGTAMLLLALAVLVCLFYATAPWYVMLLGMLVLILAPHLPASWALAAPGDAGFTRWAVEAVAALILVDVLRWLQLQRPRASQMHGVGRAMVFALNRPLLALAERNAKLATPSFVPNSAALLRVRPDRLQPMADLRRTGPQFLHRSLRVALGTHYMPRTWDSIRRGWLRQAFPLLIVLAVIAWLVWSMGMAKVTQFLTGGGGATLLEFYAVLFAAGAVLGVISHLRSLWRETNTQLPLLALLPRLGGTQVARGELLRTIVGKPLRTLGGALVIIVGLSWYALGHRQLPAAAAAFDALVPVLWFGVLMVGVLHVLGGATAAAQTIMAWVVYPACLFLSTLSLALPLATMHWFTPAATSRVIAALAVAWFVLAWLLCTLAWRGAMRFRQRPHPFLANAH